MFKGNQFLTELVLKEVKKKRYLLADIVGSKTNPGDRHRKNYYSQEHIKTHQYTLKKEHPDIGPVGTKVKIDNIVVASDGKKMRYHGSVNGKLVPMSHFMKPRWRVRTGYIGKGLEQKQIEALADQIDQAKKEQNSTHIKMKLSNGIKRVAGIEAVKGSNSIKADAFTYEIDKHGNKKINHYLSLKGDRHQQWGGFSDLKDYPTMKSAINTFSKVKEKLAPGKKFLPRQTKVHLDLDEKKPEHREMIHKSMYGRDHGGDYGLNNVHAIYGGNTIGLQKSEHPRHGTVYSFHPNALYVNRNDDTSDVVPSKILLTYRNGLDQEGSGGRIVVIHKKSNQNSVHAHEVLKEEAIMNTTSGIAGLPPDTPPVRKKKREEYGTSEFGGRKVWRVSEDVYYKAMWGKRKAEHYETYLEGCEYADEIRDFGRQFWEESIILQNEKTGAMVFLKYGRK